MIPIETATMPDGTEIQIEDWSVISCFSPNSALAAYAISKISQPGPFAPKGNERYRFAFHFESEKEAKAAFDKLKSGKAELSEYVSYLWDRELADCITGICDDRRRIK